MFLFFLLTLFSLHLFPWSMAIMGQAMRARTALSRELSALALYVILESNVK
jgi:hypothetical protein